MSEVFMELSRMIGECDDIDEVEVYCKLTFPSCVHRAYWQYLYGLLTEDEFFDSVGITSYEEQDHDIWQRVKVMQEKVRAGDSYVRYQ